MKSLIAASAILLAAFITSQANAASVTWQMLMPNMDTTTVELTDQPAEHPFCKGKQAAFMSVKERGAGTYKRGEGCWEHTKGSEIVSVDMWKYYDGSSSSFPIKLKDISNEPDFSLLIGDGPAGDAQKPGATFDALGSVQDNASVYMAGVCDAMGLAELNAKTDEQKKIVRVLKDAILKVSEGPEENLNDYCSAKKRMYETMEAAK